MYSPNFADRVPELQVAEDRYSAQVVKDPQELKVCFKGTISTLDPGAVINPFVDAVHERALGSGVNEVKVDLTSLEFCNSSGFKSFIHWIERIQQAPEPKRYRLRFISTKERRWQRASLLALSCYGVNIVQIEEL